MPARATDAARQRDVDREVNMEYKKSAEVVVEAEPRRIESKVCE